MQMGISDVPPAVDEDSTKTVQAEALKMDEIINDIKELIENHEDPKEQLAKYINDVEEKIESNLLLEVDKEEIKKLVEKHPYFKNPSTYHIRMITIMKYLKKKGMNINIPDFDLLVDEIILTIDGVEKIGYDRYKRKKHG